MTARWRFEVQRRSQKSRDPMQASFFTNTSLENDAHALVREAIQNSLDARSTSTHAPAYVRFFIGNHPAQNRVMERYITKEAWLHFNSSDNGLQDPPNSGDDCRFLVYEDFNTDGLIGDERADKAGPNNSFYYFMRAEGQSGKEDEARGRHGIGKYVFPYTSRIRMFFALTVRSDDLRHLIAGQSVLKSHQVNKTLYTPDGWWGQFEDEGQGDYFQLPINDGALFEQMTADFSLNRNPTQSGLSLIMPYIQQDLKSDGLAIHVIREYFWPILNGQLVVETQEQGQAARIIDDSTISKILGELGKLEEYKESADAIRPCVELAYRALIKNDHTTISLDLPESSGMSKWTDEYVSKHNVMEIHKELARPGATIQVRCPLYIKRTRPDTEETTAYFDIYLTKDFKDGAHKPVFVREGISIPEDRVSKSRGYHSIVVIEAGPLATLLGDAENPAHTEWESNAPKFKGKYKWGPSTINFVRLSVGKLLSLMNQDDGEVDVTVLSDIFYLDLPENDDEVPESRRRRRRAGDGSDTPPAIGPVPPVQPRPYRLVQSDGGFEIRGSSVPLSELREYRVKVAYDFTGASKARAMKLWDKNDFDLGSAKHVNKPVIENLSNVQIGGNTIEFQTSSSDFCLSVTGFDRRRDIIVDVVSARVSDATI